MLQKIREKSQGVFAWIILILICVPFALWGIQNYVGGGSELAIASVGDKDFFQQDLNRAYQQYSQNLAGKTFDENLIKKQALEKLIQDEVLLQHVQEEGLVVADDVARRFIQTLEYFQTDGKFDKKQYKALLAGQSMSSAEFVSRIKQALVMEQYQRSVMGSGFATEKEVENFFKIQNQKRKVEIISVALPIIKEQATEQQIEEYYQKNQNVFLTEEQVAIEYVELSLDDLAKQIKPTNDQLLAYYQEQKEQYTTKERRKISHILFAFTKETGDDDKQLERALKAKAALKDKDFSILAAEVSDDKLTAEKGGDLGLFNVGVMEKDFEDVASSLQLGEVSDPVKSAFGYHLIKVTELMAGETKSFDSARNELTTAYQRAKAETTYYELGETLTDLSYENPDSLKVVADELGIAINKTELFGKQPAITATGIISEPVIVNAAFSEDVLKGNNSEPIELGSDKLIVLRMLEYQAEKAKELQKVKQHIVKMLSTEKARKLATEKAEKIKMAVVSGKTMDIVANENGVTVKKISDLSRSNGELAWQVNQEIFKAAKPLSGKTTVLTVSEPSGNQSVVNVLAVTEGIMSEADKAQMKLAQANMAKAFGEADFRAVMNNLRASIDVRINSIE